ncbi:MAG: hypothetical protein SV186_00315 [Candidatus Nanohaloarchaea archaeon]|nr:hypothetical protein [Candidatus Nanohaloarchaea archaeon]
MNQGRNILGLALLTVLIAGLSASAVAAAPQITFVNPANQSPLSGVVAFNVTNTSGDFNDANTRFNFSRNSTVFASSLNETDPNFVNLTQDTTGWNDGFYRINATAYNASSGAIYDSNFTWITIDNTDPSINVTTPDVDGNFTTTSELIEANVTDNLSSISAADYVLKNGSTIKKQGSLSLQAGLYNTTVDFSGQTDGTYTLLINTTDAAGNTANVTQTIHIDYNPPSISFNSDANFINVTITDKAWSVNASTAVFTLEDSSGTLLNGTGGTASSNTSLVDQNNDFYTYDINTSDFTAGNYTLHIWANDTNDNQGNNVHTTFYIDERAPNVTGLMINDTSNASSFYKITNETVFSLNATYSDNIGVASCSYNVYNESEWANGAATRSGGMNLSVVAASTANVSEIDLTGLQGNYTFQVSCRDYASNTATNTTIEMTGGTTVSWFPVDDAGPYVVDGSISPANESYVASTDPAIGLDLQDFSTIDNSSITAWFNGNLSNVTLSGDNTTTLTVRLDQSSLQDGKEYSVIINSSDARGVPMGNVSFNFTVDTTAPTRNNFNLTTSGTDGPGGTTWYNSGINIDAECTDTTAGIANYTLAPQSSGNGDGDNATGSGQQTLTFSPAADTVDSSVTLTVTCTDKAGNSNSTTFDVAIDTSAPTLETKQPTSDKTKSSLPYSQTFTVRVEDTGSGFTSGGWYTTTDTPVPYVDGTSQSDYGPTVGNDYIEYSWSTSIDEGSHSVSFDNGGDLVVQDAAGNDLTVNAWSFNVSKSATQNLTNPNLEVGSPTDISLIPGRSKTVSITVDNTGDAQADVTVTTDNDNNDLTITPDPSDFTLDAGSSQQVDVTVQASEQFSGSPSVSVTFSYGGNSDTVSFNVNANEGSPTLNIASAPTEVSITAGNFTAISLSVENSGTAKVNGLTPALGQFTLTSATPSALDVPTGQTRSIDLNISVPGNHEIGVFPTTVTLSNDDHSVTKELSIKVQPSSNATRQNISLSLNTLRETVNNIQNETLKQELTQKINDAQTAIVANDYAQAAEIIETIKKQIQGAETSTAPSGRRTGGGIPILPLLIAILVLVGAAGVLAYVFLISPDEGGGEATFSETSNRIEEIGKEFLDATGNLIAKVERFFSNLLGSEEENEASDEEDVEVDRKKIRFDEV